MKYWGSIVANGVLTLFLLLRGPVDGQLPQSEMTDSKKAEITKERVLPDNRVKENYKFQYEAIGELKSASEAGLDSLSRREAYVEDWIVSKEGDLLEEAASDIGIAPEMVASLNAFLNEKRQYLETKLAELRSLPVEEKNSTVYRFPALSQEWQGLVTEIEDRLLKDGVEATSAWSVAALIGDSRAYRPYSEPQALYFNQIRGSDILLGWEVGSREALTGSLSVIWSNLKLGQQPPKDEVTRRFARAVDFNKILESNE